MSDHLATALRRLRSLFADDSGQVLPTVTIGMVLLLAVTSLSVDVGRAYYTQRRLQASTDAAALAGAQAMLNNGETPTMVVGPSGTGGVVGTYSSTTGGYNASSNLPSVTETASLKCYQSLEALGQPCIGTVPYNAVQVQQVSVLPTYFAGIFGKKTLTLTATSTASARGGAPKPSNVAVILDTTLSEDAVDTDCVVNGQQLTEMQCSLNGLQVLLKALQPCGINQSTCSPKGGYASNSFDRVALFTFPDVTPATAAIDASCTSPVPTPTQQNMYYNTNIQGTSVNYSLPFYFQNSSGSYVSVAPWSSLPTAAGYSFPQPGASSYSALTTALGNYNPQSNAITYGLATYQLTDYLSDYRTSNSSTSLNTSSALVIASGAAGCGGMAPSNWDGMYGTYYAGVIYAAQASLVAEQAANPGSENVIILISDGDATAPEYYSGYFPVMPPSGTSNPATGNGTYPSWTQECSQAVTAANYATAQGTTVYTVAYGSEPAGCLTDINPAISPCNTMAAMASAPQEFYSDYKQSGSGSSCVASQPVTAIADIFASIANDLTEARLIPNNTT